MFTSAVLLAFLPGMVSANPTLGFGFTFRFGAEGAEPGLSLRVFSDNQQDQLAATLGLDYLPRTRSVLPTLGAAYIGTGVFLGFDLGFGQGGISPGFSGGHVNSAAPVLPETVPAPVAPVMTAPVTTLPTSTSTVDPPPTTVPNTEPTGLAPPADDPPVVIVGAPRPPYIGPPSPPDFSNPGPAPTIKPPVLRPPIITPPVLRPPSL